MGQIAEQRGKTGDQFPFRFLSAASLLYILRKSCHWSFHTTKIPKHSRALKEWHISVCWLSDAWFRWSLKCPFFTQRPDNTATKKTSNYAGFDCTVHTDPNRAGTKTCQCVFSYHEPVRPPTATMNTSSITVLKSKYWNCLGAITNRAHQYHPLNMFKGTEHWVCVIGNMLWEKPKYLRPSPKRSC